MDNIFVFSKDGKEITGIKDKSILHIVIPNGITSIGSSAFEGCASLQRLDFPNSLTKIDSYAFKDCISLQSIYIPEGVTSIDDKGMGNPFSGCTSLESIIVDSNNKEFDSRDNCNAIIETSTNTIITGCKNTIIPYGITCIGDEAFADCVSLQSIDIPNTVTEIEFNAFQGCLSLQKIFIPRSVTHIRWDVFQDCKSLESIIVDNNNKCYDSRDNCNAIIETSTNTIITGCKNTIIPKGVTCIDAYAFAGCSSLQSIEIPDSITVIGERAFAGCSSLRKIFIPHNVTAIGWPRWHRPEEQPHGGNGDSFIGCTSLDSIVVDNRNKHFDSRDNCNAIIETSTNTIIVGCNNTIIPDGITYIGRYSFEGRTSLNSIDIPNSVTEIFGAFEGCTSLKSIDIPNSVTNISRAFKGCTSLKSIDIPNSVTNISRAFEGCTSLKSIDIPNSVTEISGAFEGCTSLESIDIPNSVTEISGAFEGCTSLKSIDIPNSVTNISRAFKGCTSLKSIDIPNSVTEIGAHTFGECTSIEIMEIPNSVTKISTCAFCKTPAKEFVVEEGNLYFKSINGVLFSKTGFTYNDEDICILVKYPPHNTLSKYVLDSNIHKIGSCAFLYANYLEEIILHDGILSFGDKYTFAGCTSLKEIQIPYKVKRLPFACFEGCKALEHVFVPDREELHVESEAFKVCISIKGLHLRMTKPEKIVFMNNVFDDDIFEKCKLFIPSGTRWAYRHHPILGKFKNIEIEK